MAIIYRIRDRNQRFYIGKYSSNTNYMDHHMEWKEGSIYPWSQEASGYRFEKEWYKYLQTHPFDHYASGSNSSNNYIQSLKKYDLENIKKNITDSITPILSESSWYKNWNVKNQAAKIHNGEDLFPTTGEDFIKRLGKIMRKNTLEIIEALLIIFQGYHSTKDMLNTKVDFLSNPQAFLSKGYIEDNYLKSRTWKNHASLMINKKIALPVFYASYNLDELKKVEKVSSLIEKRIASKNNFYALNFTTEYDSLILSYVKQPLTEHTLKRFKQWIRNIDKMINDTDFLSENVKNQLRQITSQAQKDGEEWANKFKQNKGRKMQVNTLARNMNKLVKELDKIFQADFEKTIDAIQIDILVAILKTWVKETSEENIWKGGEEDVTEKLRMEEKYKEKFVNEIEKVFNRYWDQDYYDWKRKQEKPLNLCNSYLGYYWETYGVLEDSTWTVLMTKTQRDIHQKFPNWKYVNKYWHFIYGEQVSYWLIHNKNDTTFQNFKGSYKWDIKQISNIDDMKYY